MFDWLAPLGVPLIRRAVVTLLVAGATFSLYGVFIITQGLTVIRFSLLHVGLPAPPSPSPAAGNPGRRSSRSS